MLKIAQDYRVPPQHNIQFYLKAKNPEELETFYKNSEYYFSKLIRRTNSQLEYLHKIKANSTRAEKYEKKNFMRFIGSQNIKEAEKSYRENNEYERVKNSYENNVVLTKFETQNKLKKEEITE